MASLIVLKIYGNLDEKCLDEIFQGQFPLFTFYLPNSRADITYSIVH